jgi:hypothetical protein
MCYGIEDMIAGRHGMVTLEREKKEGVDTHSKEATTANGSM